MAVKAVAIGATLALTATQAFALSCAQPQIERSFDSWVDAEETYYIGVGTLEPIGTVPKTSNGFDPSGGIGGKEPITAQYMFSGRLLDGAAGVLFEHPITVRVTCVASWCGSFPKIGAKGLMALRGVGIRNLTLDMHACPGSIFPAETEATVSECMRVGKCEEG